MVAVFCSHSAQQERRKKNKHLSSPAYQKYICKTSVAAEGSTDLVFVAKTSQ